MIPKLTRRQILKVGALGVAGVVLSSCTLATRPVSNSAGTERFHIDLPVPEELKPDRSDATTDYYTVVQKQARQRVIPGKLTTIWGYNGVFPGPTIRAKAERTVVIRQINRLAVPTVVHLHGGKTPSMHDGFPTDIIGPGHSRVYRYPNQQHGATLWYHDHAMDRTGKNVWMGLAGMYILEDDRERSLNLPSGEYDIPLIIQARQFENNGQFKYDNNQNDGAIADTVLVNGVARPRLKVSRRKYRFRILNGSNAQMYRLALSSQKPFTQIATDGGLMEQSIQVREIPLAEAERAEVVVDFRNYPIGSKVALQDVSRAVDKQLNLMMFEIYRNASDDSQVPTHLNDIPPIPEASAVHTRDFDFGSSPAMEFPPSAMTINGKTFDEHRVDANPNHGDVEIWRLRSGTTHPVHVHAVQFQILDRDGQPPTDHERGWKDTVFPGSGTTRIIVRFDGERGKYVLHCHNLEHEDHYMMARYDIV